MMNQICSRAWCRRWRDQLRPGLDVERALDVINRARRVVADGIEGAMTPTSSIGFVDWMRKDLSLCLAEARARGAALPVTALVDQFYARVQAQGGGRWDSSSLIRVLRDVG
jgi:3-hydroxyisobutyrate dehydrogenase-like beta-hydroxyacid dehydrogenase